MRDCDHSGSSQRTMCISSRYVFANASDKTKLYSANEHVAKDETKNGCSKHKTETENANDKTECHSHNGLESMSIQSTNARSKHKTQVENGVD